MLLSISKYPFLAFLLFAFNIAIAETKIFQKTYVRATGAPEKVVDKFYIQAPDGRFLIIIENGDGKRGRVASAIVELNGSRIVGPESFNKNADTIRKSISVHKENEIAVEVRSEPGTSIVVSIVGQDISSQSPLSGVTISPNTLPINQATSVIFMAAVPYKAGGFAPQVTLERLSNKGAVVAEEGLMLDNGQMSVGDEVYGDGIFSFRKRYLISEPGKINFRVKIDDGRNVNYSDSFTLTAFTPIPQADSATINSIQQDGERLFYEILPTMGRAQALAEVVKFIKGHALVIDAGINESQNSIWINYSNGISGGIIFGGTGTRGGLTTSTSSSVATTSNSTEKGATERYSVQTKRYPLGEALQVQRGRR